MLKNLNIYLTTCEAGSMGDGKKESETECKMEGEEKYHKKAHSAHQIAKDIRMCSNCDETDADHRCIELIQMESETSSKRGSKSNDTGYKLEQKRAVYHDGTTQNTRKQTTAMQ
eukprot:178863_1